MSKSIIIYYSRAGQNYVGGTLKMLTTGNTEVAAKKLREMTGSDIFKAEPSVEYSDDYNECIEQALQDKNRGARPSLKKYPEDLGKYDTIYLGYPNFWGTMPMAMFTLLERQDLAGVDIRPFCTNEGSGMGTSESDIRKTCPGANVLKGLAIRGGSVDRSDEAIEKWIKG